MKTVSHLIINAILISGYTARASGWPIGKHKIQMIPYFYFYTADSYKTKTGSGIKYAYNGRFTGILVKQYVEYGISNKLSITADLPIAFNKYKDDISTLQKAGTADVMTGVKWNVYANSSKTSLLTVQGSAIIPGYKNNTQTKPQLGYGLIGTELRAMYSGAGSKPYSYFHNSEAAFRYFSGSIQTVRQFHFNVTGGLYIKKKNIFSTDISGIFSGGTEQDFMQTSPLQNASYRFIKCTFQYGRQFSEKLWVYAGLFSDLYNKNTGIGKGFSVFCLINL